MAKRRAAIIGGGIGGLSAALALRQAGLEVEVFERAQELKERGAGLGILSNAVSALRSLGVEGALETRGQVINEFKLLDSQGRLLSGLPIQALQEQIGVRSVSIHRAALQRVLLDANHGCKIQLGAKLERFESDGRTVCAHFADGRSAEADMLLGADGLHSATRRQITGDEAAHYGGYTCWVAALQFAHPRLTPGYVGFYWGPGTGFGLIDLGGGQAYWWGTHNRAQRVDPTESAASIKARVNRCYAGWADEVSAAIAATPDACILQYDALDRPFIERWGSGPVSLLGDAAHPMLTSLAQGACMAMEDAAVLGSSLKGEADLARALRRYEDARRPRTRLLWRFSRIMAVVEQLENPVALALRNAYWRVQWPSMQRAQMLPLMTFADPFGSKVARQEEAGAQLWTNQ